MSATLAVMTGWLVPGGGYLFTHRYRQFAIFLTLICGLFAAGLALHGGFLWPGAEDLLAKTAALAKGLAGGPYLIAVLFSDPNTYTEGRVHEYGTTLLTMAGILNVLAIADSRG